MALLSNLLRTCGLLCCLILYVCAVDKYKSEPWINIMKVDSKTCVENKCKYLLTLYGGDFLGHSSWRLTPTEGHRGDSCVSISPNYEVREIETTQTITKIEVSIPDYEGKLYFCLYTNNEEYSPFGGKWVHQGEKLFLSPKSDAVAEVLSHSSNLQEAKPEWTDISHDTDVNYLPNVTRPTREEMGDIEVLINDRYVILTDLNALDDKSKNKEVALDINGQNGLKDTFSEDARTENSIDFYKETEINRVRREISINVKIDGINDATSVLSNRKTPVGTISSPAKLDVTTVAVDTKTDESTVSIDTLLSPQRIIEAKKHEQNSIEIVNSEEHPDALIAIRKQRQVTVADDYLDYTNVRVYPSAVQIEGLRVEGSNKDPKLTDEGVPSVLADATVTLRLFGDGLTPRTVIAFTHDALELKQPCKFLLKGEYMVLKESITPRSALFEIKAPTPLKQSKLYICAKNLRPGVTDPSKDEDKYLHQGKENFKTLETHNPLLPLWVSLCLILICLTFSALFSGLNLGLMSLDRTELKIIANTGTEQERKYARAIMPVRDHGNYLLCSILLGNVAVNSTFTILLDELTSGLFAVIFSTLSIVLLGEITPQAICSRHGLMIGAKSIMITKTVMGLTAPLAYPVSKLLDYFLGEEIGSVYNRERLKELVKVTTDMNDLDRDEVNIISGTLELRKKTVADVMTKLDDVFMLPITSVLDFETMSEIIKSGYSRIPVYEGNRGNIVTVLFIKDLAFVDPDDNTPLQTLCQYYQNACNFVFEDVTLDVMFKQFKDGHKGHMAFVHRINNEGEGDPFYETIGLVTLEDVIEEMIQAEIVDETDVFLDNRTKRRRKQPSNKLQDFTAFAERHENQRIHISPQLTLATFQFLNTSVDAFRPDTISETVLRRLLRQDVIHYIKLKGKTKKDPSTYVFQQGKPVDYFVLILEGRVEVTVGRENLVFEAGPFTYFGVQALTQNIGVAESPTPSAMGSLQNINMDSMLRHTFVPDYSVRATTELYYLTVKRSLYLAAKRATLMEKGALSKGATNEQFDTEVDKLLQSVDEDLSITGEHKTPSRQISPNPPLPVSASPLTRASFTAQSLPQSPPESRNGNLYSGTRPEEQEKLLK